MEWLEIIEFKSEEIESKILEKDIENLIRKLKKESDEQAIKIYSRVAEVIDLSVHIHHRTIDIKKSGTPLGTDISKILREFGIIKHTVWV
jgi:hypothetical protein